MVKQSCPLSIVKLLSRQIQDVAGGNFIERGECFKAAKSSRKHAKRVHHPAFESAIAKAFPKRNVVATASRDLTREMVFYHLDLSCLAVNSNCQS